MQDYWLTEAAQIAAKVLDVCGSLDPPLLNPRQDRCPHGFVDQGKDRCELCDRELAARVARERTAHLSQQKRYARELRQRRRIGANG